MSIGVFSEVITSNDSTVTGARNERIGISSEFAVIGIDELAKNGDSSFERNDKGNYVGCSASAKAGRMEKARELTIIKNT